MTAPALACRSASARLAARQSRPAFVAARSAAPRAVRMAASPEENSAAPIENGTVFYGGKSYTSEQWSEVLQSGNVPRPAAAGSAGSRSTGSAVALSWTDVMGFSGTAPEIVNGRLAMLGFVSAAAAELVSGESVLKQWSEEPTGVALAFILFIAGSLVTAFKTRRDDSLGPFTPQAELINGRAAMIGFAAMLIIEAVRGTPLI